MILRKFPLFFVFFLLSAYAMKAEVRLPGFFTDHIVLQRDAPVKVWGWADKNESIEVVFNGQKLKTHVQKDGTWVVTLKAMAYGGPYTMLVKGKNNLIELNDVLIGDVWYCGGQSNMEMKVKECYNAEEEIRNADYPLIRSLRTPKKLNIYPQENFQADWKICSPATTGDFSAVAYFFARMLYNELKIPIGILDVSWGGTGIESWTNKESLLGLPEQIRSKYVPSLDDADFEIKYLKIDKERQAFREAVKRDPELKKKQKEPTSVPDPSPTLLYNSLVNPLIKFRIKGVIWYQGEHNVRNAYEYRTLFPNLIHTYRKIWEYDFPFYWAQITSFSPLDKTPQESDWAELREAQTLTLSVQGTGQAITYDIGDADTAHPKNKQDVGKRLALIVLNKDYDRKDLIFSGPTFENAEIKGDKIVLTFGNIGSGLVTSDKYDYIKGFTIAGADRRFEWAQAYIENGKVIVFSKKIANPVHVRYAWATNTDANLYNKEGLPAVPFRTDN
jgi:sialate O-acetylesterase